ncbi:MAG TPA: hypothetical protein VI413_00600 [Paludibacter sp.]
MKKALLLLTLIPYFSFSQIVKTDSLRKELSQIQLNQNAYAQRSQRGNFFLLLGAGGIIANIALKDKNPNVANTCLYFAGACSFVGYAIHIDSTNFLTGKRKSKKKNYTNTDFY